MTSRTITLRAFCSAKGGVGKSTLAVAAAKLLAARGRAVVVLDADLTGTSLADGLDLCAPKLSTLDDGTVDYLSASGELLDRGATVKARDLRARAVPEIVPPPPFLSDLLVYPVEEDAELPLASLFWRMRRDDGVRYLPSSPLANDVSMALGWLDTSNDSAWTHRLVWLLDAMLDRAGEIDDIVFDLPPGLFGFSVKVLSLLSHLQRLEELQGMPPGYPRWERRDVQWRCDPVLVTSQDRNDLWACVDWYARNRADLLTLRLLVNKHTLPLPRVEKEATERLNKLGLPIDRLPLRGVGLQQGTLARVFSKEHDMKLDDLGLLRAALLGEEEM